MIGLIILLALGYGASYLITCGLVYLVTLCFGWTFSWAIATGVWLIFIILRALFKN